MSRNIQTWLLVLLSGFVVYPYFLQSMIVIFVTIINLFVIRKQKLNIKRIRLLIFLNAWVFFTVISLLWTDNLEEGFKYISKLGTYFLITVNVLLLIKEIDEEKIKYFSIGFIIFTWIALLLHESHFMSTLYLDSFIEYFKTPFNTITQIGVYDTPFILDFHKAYFSIFMLIALCLIGFILTNFKHKGYLILILPFIHFTMEIIHMMSVINVVLLLLFLCVFSLRILTYLFKKNDNNKLIIGITGLFIVVGFISYQVLNDSYLARKVDKTIKFINSDADSPNTTKVNRKFIWKEAFSIINKNPFGVGIGDVQDKMQLKYKERGFEKLYEKKINSHNQFIHFALIGGYSLLIIFITIIVFLFKRNLARMFLLLCLIILTGNLLTENLLFRINGLWVYGLFFSLFSVLTLNTINNNILIGKEDG